MHSVMPRTAAAVIAVRAAALAAAIAPGCHQSEDEDASLDGDVADERPADAEDGADADAEVDVDVAWTPGPLTLVTRELTLLEDRPCDLDGDGDLDNAIADLGSPYSSLYAMAIAATVNGAIDDGLFRLMLHFQWLEQSPAVADTDIGVVMFRGADTDYPRDPSDDFTGEEQFYADARFLDACGEPIYLWPEGRVEARRFGYQGVAVGIELAGGDAIVHGDFEGEFGPDGRTLEGRMCASARIADVGAAYALEGLSSLELILAGGELLGIVGPGVLPDLDLDGDGLERFTLDETGRIEACIDGDGFTVIDGRDCWRDPRMADGFALSFGMSLLPAAFAGREPGWELMVPGRCDGGLPAESAFGEMVHEGACAQLGERCDPLVADPCCDPEQVCRGNDDVPYLCSSRCTPEPCDYGGRPGLCAPAAGWLEKGLLCLPVDNDIAAAECTAPEGGCTTEYGVSTQTTCVEQYATERRVCLESCSGFATGCGLTGRMCFPLITEEGGYCY
jgi:hypothetical protein